MRAKLVTLLVVAAAGATALGAGSQPWISFSLEGAPEQFPTGHDLNAALSPVAIAIVVAALALSIAGPIFRRVLGLLVAALGAGVVALAAAVAANPASAMAARVTELTGLSGHGGLAAVANVTLTPWSWVTIAAGFVAALAGLVVVFTSGRWRSAGRKYEAASSKAPAQKPDRISDWDALSEGEDPTAGGDPEPDQDAAQGNARA